MADIKIIKIIKVTFMHDSGEVHWTYYNLTDSADIEDMAMQIQHYYVVGLEIMEVANHSELEMPEIK